MILHQWLANADGTRMMPRPPKVARCGACGCEMILTGKEQPHVLFRKAGRKTWTRARPECASEKTIQRRENREPKGHPMTLREFEKKLTERHYSKPLHARRAFRGIAPKDRKRASALVDKHFGKGRQK